MPEILPPFSFQERTHIAHISQGCITMRQVIGYFIVHQPDGVERVVVVSQEVTTGKTNAIVAARKVFTLDTADGEEVVGCETKRSFTQKDGKVLRIIGQCIANETDLSNYHMRKRLRT